MFFVCLSRFGITKFVITETLWSSVIFKTSMASLHAVRFVVVHLCSTFSVDAQNFPLGANLYQKLQFRDFGGTFLVTTVKFGMMVQTLDSLPKPNFVKIA